MTFVFNAPAIENRLFNAVMDSLKGKPNIMSCGFSTIVPHAISITVFALQNLEREEIEKIKFLLNTILANEGQKKEWSEFSIDKHKITDCVMNYEFMTTGGQTTLQHSLLYFVN